MNLRPILFLLVLVSTLRPLHAQTEVDERALIEMKDGISIRKDSLFLLNLRFRMQNRLGFTTVGGDDLSTAVVDARVRRLRLRFDGFVLREKLQYYIQLNFSRADLDLDGDRSIANSAFTLDRDYGVFAYWTLPMGAQQVQLKGALTTGDGRGAPPGNSGMGYTGRVEWLPLGPFTNKGDYSEGDLEFEPRPKLSFGATYHHNDRAYRTGGQLGSELYQGRTFSTVIADAVLKYQGWALSSEFFDRRCDDPVTTNALNAVRFVQTGQGVNLQLSKLFRNHYEIATRYTGLQPGGNTAALWHRTEEALLGGGKYLNGHRIKLQTYIGYRWLDGRMNTFTRAAFSRRRVRQPQRPVTSAAL